MKDNEYIKKLINDCRIQTGPSVDQRVMAEALDRFDQNCEKSSALSRPNRWIFIMNSPLVKLGATAVAAGIMVILLLLPKLETRVYALTEVMDKVKSVRTISFREMQYRYDPEDVNDSGFVTATIIPRDLWLDVPNMKERILSFANWWKPDATGGLGRVEYVRTAEIAFHIIHGRKEATYFRHSPIKRRLEVRKSVEKILDVDYSIIHDFERVGQQRFEGNSYDIWQWKGPVTLIPNLVKKIQCWVSRDTGYLGRKLTWYKQGENKPWRLQSITEEIRLNEPIDEARFTMTVPEGYLCKQTLEDAEVGEGLGMGWYPLGNARMCYAISFILDDGTFIAAWHSDDLQGDPYVDQSHLFKDLIPGGPLPKLPAVISGIKSVSLGPYTGPEVRYTGYHLAHTQKNGWFYEWAFYIPHSDPIPKGTPDVGYRQLCEFNLKEPQESSRGNFMDDYWIEPSEFDMFVRGAMGELSDDGKAPEYVTHDYLLKLCEQVRSERIPR